MDDGMADPPNGRAIRDEHGKVIAYEEVSYMPIEEMVALMKETSPTLRGRVMTVDLTPEQRDRLAKYIK